MNDLTQFIQTTRDSRELKRALAVKMTLEKRPWKQVAHDLAVTTGFISKWRSKYTKEGLHSLRMGYKGSTGSLSRDERAEVIQWIQAHPFCGVDGLYRYLDVHYTVVYAVKQSYYNLLHDARISWKKTQKTNPNSDPAQVKETRQTIEQHTTANALRILEKERIYFFVDECHLLWGDMLGYAWGPMGERIDVPITNERDRQTYYGALNFLTGRGLTFPAAAGNSEQTVAFLKHLRWRFQGRPLVLLWDRASYHGSALVKEYLKTLNGDRPESERRIHCLQFAPHAPVQNPIEDMWLAAKRYIRKQWQHLTTFAQVKTYFTQFIECMTLRTEKFNWYGRDKILKAYGT